jgi:hypothetical protein
MPRCHVWVDKMWRKKRKKKKKISKKKKERRGKWREKGERKMIEYQINNNIAEFTYVKIQVIEEAAIYAFHAYVWLVSFEKSVPGDHLGGVGVSQACHDLDFDLAYGSS